MALGERDPVTGRMTTGHEWNGIKELDTPVPKVVTFFLLLGTLIAILLWILMPAWPLGDSYTKGLLGWDQRSSVESKLLAAGVERASWSDEIARLDFTEIQADPALMKIAREAGQTLFGDNCAVCHGTGGTGSTGYPDLTAGAWLWGGDAESIAETLRVGINAAHDETRLSEMLAFGRDGLLERSDIRDLVGYVQSLGATSGGDGASEEVIARGAESFVENCSSCHGEDARGIPEVGAPDLTDDTWLYGGDREAIYRTIFSGRMGHMPSWEKRLTEVERKILTLHVLSLQEPQP